MKKLSMTDVAPAAQRAPRIGLEDSAQKAVKGPDGRHRLKAGKTKQVIFRVTDEKRAQLVRLADRLSIGKAVKVSFTETMEQALDALEAKFPPPSRNN